MGITYGRVQNPAYRPSGALAPLIARRLSGGLSTSRGQENSLRRGVRQWLEAGRVRKHCGTGLEAAKSHACITKSAEFPLTAHVMA
jgi:hypothetical protein